MARNAPHIMTSAETITANANRVLLSERIGQVVRLDYVKRDGSARILTGEVVRLYGTRKGSASTEAVEVATSEGPRSANLWGIRSVLTLEDYN